MEVNVWKYKPWWCQPWSIVLTGLSIVGGCWLLTKWLWLTIIVSIPVSIWWLVFLILYPRSFRTGKFSVNSKQ